MAHALGVLDEQHIAGSEHARLAGGRDFHRSRNADDQLPLMFGLFCVAAAGRSPT